MSDRLPNSSPLTRGKAYWVAVPFDGPGISPVESSDLRVVSMEMSFFPLPSSLDHLGSLTMESEGFTVGGVSRALCDAWGVERVVIADPGRLSALLGVVASGYGTQEDIYKLRDGIIDLGAGAIGGAADLVRWLPWIIAGAAAVGLAVLLYVEVKS